MTQRFIYFLSDCCASLFIFPLVHDPKLLKVHETLNGLSLISYRQTNTLQSQYSDMAETQQILNLKHWFFFFFSTELNILHEIKQGKKSHEQIKPLLLPSLYNASVIKAKC